MSCGEVHIVGSFNLWTTDGRRKVSYCQAAITMLAWGDVSSTSISNMPRYVLSSFHSAVLWKESNKPGVAAILFASTPRWWRASRTPSSQARPASKPIVSMSTFAALPPASASSSPAWRPASVQSISVIYSAANLYIPFSRSISASSWSASAFALTTCIYVRRRGSSAMMDRRA
jgi:hypothetical protein